MKATVLIDNIGSEELIGEWGLSILIEHNGEKILLDGGTSGKFIDNAAAMGIKLDDVKNVVLSHAHYDHSDGLVRFFNENRQCRLYLRDSVCEDCYAGKAFIHRYIGISKGFLKAIKDRVIFVSGNYELMPGLYLIPHSTEGLSAIGRSAMLYRKKSFFKYVPDDFDHEHSLVIRENDGIVIFSSCSHAGADNIINEIKDIFPGERIKAMIGGFHLFRSSDDYVEKFAKRVKETGIERIYTGHCTGKKAFEILKKELGENAIQLRCGLVIEL